MTVSLAKLFLLLLFLFFLVRIRSFRYVRDFQQHEKSDNCNCVAAHASYQDVHLILKLHPVIRVTQSIYCSEISSHYPLGVSWLGKLIFTETNSRQSTKHVSSVVRYIYHKFKHDNLASHEVFFSTQLNSTFLVSLFSLARQIKMETTNEM
jgi:hypothetical protein